MNARTSASLSGVLLLSWATCAGAQVPAGPEFMLTEGFGSLRGARPAGTVLPSGDSIVVWNSRLQDGETVIDVFGRRFDRRGQPLGGEFRVNTYTTGVQRQAAARPATDGRGNVVIVWRSETPTGAHVFGQHFASGGGRLGGEFQIDVATSGETGYAHVDRTPDGRFVVVWDAVQAGGDERGVLARRYDAAGNPVGAPFRVNTYTTGEQYAGEVAVREDGSFVVAWGSNGQDGDSYGVFAQRFDGGGNRLGAELQVNTYTTSAQYVEALGLARDGRFVVSWMSVGQDGDDRGVFAQRYDAAGVRAGLEFQVAQTTSGAQAFSNVGMDEHGNFVIAWDDRPLIDPSRVLGRRYDAGGIARGDEFVVHDGGIFGTGDPAVISDGVGNFLVAFFHDQFTGADSLKGRRYQGLVPAALAVDPSGNGVLEPGESVDVKPSWQNINGESQTFNGTAPSFNGPSGATYTLVDAAASYGTVADGATTSCADCYVLSVSDPPSRPVTHWDPVLEERVTPDVQGQDKHWRVHVGRSFTDVAPANPFYRFVETLLHRGVTAGCGAAEFCPGASTKREQMAVFVLTAKEGAGYAPPACTTALFGDVPSSSPFCRWIEELARRSVVGGCGGGNYCPGEAVTREQMAVFVLRTLDPTLSPPACVPPNLFTDVPESSPFCRWIEELANRGIVSGCGGGAYCPSQPVTREQMGVFVGVPFGLTLYGP